MPGFDGSGPEGTGPNGRGMGLCGEGRNYSLRGFFGGWGGRRRWWRSNRGSGFFSVDEKGSLDAEKRRLTSQLEAVDKRLSEIKNN